MDKKFAKLQLYQMDVTLKNLREVHAPTRPNKGWINAIRESLGMSASALARKMGVTPYSIIKLEKSEAEDRITLASLRKLAQALGCELQYSLVPHKSLEAILEERAYEVVRERLRPISHSMALENQAVEKGASEMEVKLLVKEILDGPRRNLW
jgi:predicted DNA-binding mobile mystery protein A